MITELLIPKKTGCNFRLFYSISFLFVAIILLVKTSFAQEINLTGTVIDSRSPVDSCIVFLEKAGLTDTTGSDGRFSFYQIASKVNARQTTSSHPDFRPDGSIAYLKNSSGNDMYIDVIDITGRRVALFSTENLNPGNYAFTPSALIGNKCKTGFYILRIRTDNEQFTRRLFSIGKSHSNSPSQHNAIENKPLKKLSAITDTIKIWKKGYIEKRIPLTTYTGELDTIRITAIPTNTIHLDSLFFDNGELSPVFNPDTLEYAAAVDSNIYEIKITAIPSIPTARVRIGNELVPSETKSCIIPISWGFNKIVVSVIDPEKGDSTPYLLVVTRRIPEGGVVNFTDVGITNSIDNDSDGFLGYFNISFTMRVSTPGDSFKLCLFYRNAESEAPWQQLGCGSFTYLSAANSPYIKKQPIFGHLTSTHDYRFVIYNKNMEVAGDAQVYNIAEETIHQDNQKLKVSAISFQNTPISSCDSVKYQFSITNPWPYESDNIHYRIRTVWNDGQDSSIWSGWISANKISANATATYTIRQGPFATTKTIGISKVAHVEVYSDDGSGIQMIYQTEYATGSTVISYCNPKEKECNFCLEACSGLSGCCTGVGCICQSACSP